jgi:hypothetical protein
MRVAAALSFLLALGIWAGVALGAPQGPTLLPTTTLPTVPITTALPLPTTTVRLPTTTTVPRLPTTTTVPKLPTTTTTPKAPTPPPTTTTTPVSQVTTAVTQATGSATAPVASTAKSAGSTGFSSGSGGTAAGTGSRSTGSSSTAAGASASSSAQAPSATGYIAPKGPKKKQRITITFRLPHREKVGFTVAQVAPVCRTIGHFSVRGRKGTNRIPFAGRVGRKALGPGTYLIVARTRSGRIVQRLTLVVVGNKAPSPAQLRAARAANVCAADPGVLSSPGSAPSLFGGSNLASVSKPSASGPLASAPSKVTASPPSGAVLGATAAEAANAARPFLVALLMAAIVALGLASLPNVAVAGGRVNELLARHRLEITSVGAAALIAVAITFLIG